MFNKIDAFITCKAMSAKAKISEFMKKENGDVNIVSIVVLIGIAVVLALIFRKAIINLINSLFNAIKNNANNAIKTV